MGLALPRELAGLAAALGLSWPEADEDALHGLAAEWTAVAEALTDGSAESAATVRRLLGAHPGGDLDGLGAAWSAGPARQAAEAVLAAHAMATCLDTMAAVVLELKAFAVARLTALAAAMAANPALLPADPAAPTAAGPATTAAGPADSGGGAGAALAAQAAAAVATRSALRRAQASAADVVDGSIVPVLHTAERRLRRALTSTAHPGP